VLTRRPVATLLTLTILVAAVIGYRSSSWFRMQVAESVTHRATPFTELYFTHPRSIPKQLVESGPNSVSFTILNHETNRVKYRYIVVASSSGIPTIVGSGSVVVADGKSTTRMVNVVPIQPSRNYTISVQLVDRQEFIDFKATS
jgi:hypothetical protein